MNLHHYKDLPIEVLDESAIKGSGGTTAIHKISSLLDNDQLLICCCNTLFCLTLPDFSLKWKQRLIQQLAFKFSGIRITT